MIWAFIEAPFELQNFANLAFLFPFPFVLLCAAFWVAFYAISLSRRFDLYILLQGLTFPMFTAF